MDKSKELMDDILDEYKIHLGKDFKRYKNHVHRVFSICIALDKSENNWNKYAIASVFHDLGIWTNKTFDYLDPSISLASKYLKNSDTPELIHEIEVMIDNHHKRSKYKGEYENTVEIFRRADWLDVTNGRKTFGLEKSRYVAIKKQYPLLGFHKFLVIQTLKHFLKSPLNPLPMFKK